MNKKITIELNNQGFSLVSTMTGAAIGVLVLAGLGVMFNTIFTQSQRVQARLELTSYIQEIQVRSMKPGTCQQMLGATNPLDLNLMLQSYEDTSTNTPGDPIEINLFNGEKLSAAGDGKFSKGKLKVEHLALTNRRALGLNGPNGYPVHQALLYGAFSYEVLGTTRAIAAQPWATLTMEVNPANNLITACYSGMGGVTQHPPDIQCSDLGGNWGTDRSGACTYTAPRPPPVSIPYEVWSGGGQDLGGSCTGSPLWKDGKSYAAGQFLLVVEASNNDGNGPSQIDSIGYAQCYNGRWVRR